MLDHRLRRWPSIKSTLGKSFVLSGNVLTEKIKFHLLSTPNILLQSAKSEKNTSESNAGMSFDQVVLK